MDNINTDYTIPNPTSDTPTSSLIHDCLTTDTPSTKGTISMVPYPDGGYDFAYYEESLLSTLTIRPNSELKPNTTYTISYYHKDGGLLEASHGDGGSTLLSC